MKRILFVCTGNTCRSPMAEGLLRGMAKKSGLQLEVRSAGVAAVDGLPMSDHSLSVLRERGWDGSFASRRVTAELAAWADVILTMTMSHKRQLVQRFPEAVDKTFTLKEYAAFADAAEADRERELQRRKSEAYVKLAIGQPLTDEERQLLRDDDLSGKYDIADPFGGSRQEYEETAREIESLLQRIVAQWAADQAKFSTEGAADSSNGEDSRANSAAVPDTKQDDPVPGAEHAAADKAHPADESDRPGDKSDHPSDGSDA